MGYVKQPTYMRDFCFLSFSPLAFLFQLRNFHSFALALSPSLVCNCPMALRQQDKRAGWDGGGPTTSSISIWNKSNLHHLSFPYSAKGAQVFSGQAVPGHMSQNAQGKTMPIWFSSLLLSHSHRWYTLYKASPHLTAWVLQGKARYNGVTLWSPGGFF